jgi:NitT/TauT family transport system substrate-binding protein
MPQKTHLWLPKCSIDGRPAGHYAAPKIDKGAATMSRASIAKAFICCCVSFAVVTRANALDKVKMLFPSVLELPSSGVYQIAKYKGYYKDAGLDVEFLAGQGGVNSATQVGAGNADVAAVLGDTSIIVRSKGVPVKGVALMGMNGPTLITSREEDNIRRVQDLKGKSISTIGYQDSTYFALLAMLASAGLKKDDSDIQALGPAGAIQLFVKGNVQVCACIPDWLVTAEDAGLKIRIMPSSDYVPVLGQAILSSDRMIAERPDVLHRFVQASMKAYVELRDNPVELAKVYVQAVPAHKGKEALLGRIYTYYAKYVWSGQAVAGQFDRARLSKLQDVYRDLQIIREKSPVDDLFTNQFISAR